MMTLQDTFEIHHDTCILDASSEPRWIHTRYVRDAMQIRSGYVSWARSICPAAQGAEGAPRLFVTRVGRHLGLALKGWHYRIIEHTTGYFYQEGFLPSQTEELDEEQEDKEGANNGDDGEEEEEEEASQPPAKKQKGGKGAAQAPVPAVAPAKASKARGNKAKESPRRSSSRGRK